MLSIIERFKDCLKKTISKSNFEYQQTIIDLIENYKDTYSVIVIKIQNRYITE